MRRPPGKGGEWSIWFLYAPPVYKHEYSDPSLDPDPKRLRYLIWGLPQWSSFGTHPLPTLIMLGKPSDFLSNEGHVSCSSTSWLPSDISSNRVLQNRSILRDCLSESLEPTFAHLWVSCLSYCSHNSFLSVFPLLIFCDGSWKFSCLPFFPPLLWGWLFWEENKTKKKKLEVNIQWHVVYI